MMASRAFRHGCFAVWLGAATLPQSLAAKPSVQIEVAPTVITGTLSPLVVTFDGKTVHQSSSSVQILFINGVPVKAENLGVRRFFTRTTTSRVAIVAGYGGRPVEFVLPQLQGARLKDDALQFAVNGAGAVLVNGVRLTRFENFWVWKVPWIARNIADTHILELKGEGNGPDRFYTFELSTSVLQKRGVPIPVSRQIADKKKAAGRRGLAARESVVERLEAIRYRGDLHLTDFQVGGSLAIQAAGNYSLCPEAWWTPSYALSPRIGLRFGLGLIPFSYSATGLALGIQYEGLVGFTVFRGFVLEAGGGLQTWLRADGGTHPVLDVNFALQFERYGEGRFLRRFYTGYSQMQARNKLHTIRVGVGLGF